MVGDSLGGSSASVRLIHRKCGRQLYQSRFQRAIGHRFDLFGGRLVAKPGLGAARPGRHRPLCEPQPGHRRIAKKLVHPLDHQRFDMLELGRHGPLNLDGQRAAGATLRRKTEFQRQSHLGKAGPDDLLPARHQRAFGKAMTAQRRTRQLAGQIRQIRHIAPPLGRLGSCDGFRHGGTMPKKPPLRTPDPQLLLAWYDRAARTLPWRVPPGSGLAADPYRVWLSEIMLQQTTVAAVIGYFNRFTSDYPTVAALAAAPLDDILTRWAGLGYYARARNLHACANVIVANHGGDFPEEETALLALPGIGPYTAAAIASIAFGKRAVVVDGNVERVVSRLFRVQTLLPKANADIRAHAEALTPDQRYGDYAQAMMDLGATICTPTSPRCEICPWQTMCAAFAAGDAASYPRKAPKAERPTRYGLAYWLEADGHVWLRRRAPKGLLGGMTEVPSSDWSSEYDFETAVAAAPVAARWQQMPGRAVHIFTHFRLELDVAKAVLPRRINLETGYWQSLADIDAAGLPTALRKVVELVKASDGRLL